MTTMLVLLFAYGLCVGALAVGLTVWTLHVERRRILREVIAAFHKDPRS